MHHWTYNTVTHITGAGPLTSGAGAGPTGAGPLTGDRFHWTLYRCIIGSIGILLDL